MGKRTLGSILLLLLVMFSFTFSPGVKVDAADRVHTVSSKDTVESIALSYDMSEEQLMKTNGLPDGKLYAGQKLRIINTAYTLQTINGRREESKLQTTRELLQDLKKQLEKRRLKKGLTLAD
ncbi:UNVERIFIED_ORG: LysM repeat protein [Peribacillus simplex]